MVMFPEGTRVEEPDALGLPHHGAGRLASRPARRSSRGANGHLAPVALVASAAQTYFSE